MSVAEKCQLRCGNCGNEKHYLYQLENSILVKCVKCLTFSEISVSPAKIKIDWVEDSKGVLAVF